MPPFVGHVCSRVSHPIPPRAPSVTRHSALASDCHSRNFAERDAANLGTDPSVPRRRFCAAWGVPSGPGSVPGFTHGTRIVAARSHSLFNSAQPEAELISASLRLCGELVLGVSKAFWPRMNTDEHG